MITPFDIYHVRLLITFLPILPSVSITLKVFLQALDIAVLSCKAQQELSCSPCLQEALCHTGALKISQWPDGTSVESHECMYTQSKASLGSF